VKHDAAVDSPTDGDNLDGIKKVFIDLAVQPCMAATRLSVMPSQAVERWPKSAMPQAIPT
jgi:hypothetical protein